MEVFKNDEFLRSCSLNGRFVLSPFIMLDAIDFLSCRKSLLCFSKDQVLREAVTAWQYSTAMIVPYLEQTLTAGGLCEPVVDEGQLVLGSKLHYLPEATRLSIQQEEFLKTHVLKQYHQGKVGRSIAALKILLKLGLFDDSIDGLVDVFKARSYCFDASSRFRREATDCDYLRRRIMDHSEKKILDDE